MAASGENTWTDDWEKRLMFALNCEGATSMTNYLSGIEGVSYGELAKHLSGCAPLQVALLQFREARRDGQIRFAGIDSLVRILVSRMKRGWGVGIHWQRLQASAYAEWHSIAESDKDFAVSEEFHDQGVEISKRLEDVWKALRKLAPIGWLPTSSNDPILLVPPENSIREDEQEN